MNICEAYSKNSPLSACDRVAEALVDGYVLGDKKSEVDVRTLCAHGFGMVMGRVSSQAKILPEKIALEAGERARKGLFSEILANLSFPERTDNADAFSAGSFVARGYATAETPEYLPKAYVAAHALARAFDEWREDRAESVPPDVWVFVRIVTDRRARPQAFARLFGRAASAIAREESLKQTLRVCAEKTLGEDITLTVEAGESVDAVFLSGERACMRGYDGILPGNGASFAGKDPRHPLRAGMFMARFAAKTLVAEGVAKNCLVTAVYDGEEAPILLVARDGYGNDLTASVQGRFNFRIPAIVERFDLLRPMYESLADYGPFLAAGIPWEKV